ncbi:MAG TPA: AraC family transcriptional regulator, partial [Sphingobacteriaceae bacterium]
MNALKSGIFFIHGKAFEECDWHVTRLSLNFNLDDRQVYRTPSRAYTISPEKYLLLNEGQSFKTLANSCSPNRMVTIAFQVGLADKLLQGLNTVEKQLLDEPFKTPEGKVNFLEKTYLLDLALRNSVDKLTALEDEVRVDEALEELLLELVRRQLGVRKEIISIKKSRMSTRLEVYRRLHWSLEHLAENFASDITVEDLARVACLSTFHYKRLFAEVFTLSPYQYLIKLRLEKACTLLKEGGKV